MMALPFLVFKGRYQLLVGGLRFEIELTFLTDSISVWGINATPASGNPVVMVPILFQEFNVTIY